MVHSTAPPPANRLSDLPSGSSGGPDLRDSYLAIQRMVAPEDLSVVFQPIVDLRNGSPFAHEALVRCRVETLRPPPVLFDRAVQLGCVGRLGRMIRETAMPLSSGLRLFVNLHPQELNESWVIRPDDPIFLHDSEVYLEITESAPLTHFDRCLVLLREMKSRGGIYLVVDDLGAGYSNLKTISDLEPRVVKLDRDLVVGIDRNPRQRQLVQSVVRLCTDLGAQTVVEGIETVEELKAVRDTGADFGQGYLLARPGYPIPEVTWPSALDGADERTRIGNAGTLIDPAPPRR